MAKKKAKAAPSAEGNIETQLDSLAAEVQGVKTSPAAAKGAAAAGQAPALSPAKPAEIPERSQSALDESLPGDDLAEQIQNLLDDAKRGQEEAAASPVAEAQSVEQIDDMLAASADQAVAGAFETPAEAAATTASPETAALSGESALDSEPLLEGGFATPEELLQGKNESAAAPAFNADARAVAQELDNQPELVAASPPASEPAAPPAKRAPRRPLLRGLLVTINKPLLSCSKSTRDLVGWIGLLTLFNASVLMMGRTVFHITSLHSLRHQESNSAQPQEPEKASHESAPAHEEAASHSEAKPKAKARAATKPAKKPAKPAASEAHGE